MKKLALPLIAIFMLFALSACGGDDATLAKLNGSWAIDIEGTLESDENMKDMKQEEKDFAVGLLKMMFSELLVDFDMDKKTMTFAVAGDKEVTDITVKAVDGKKITLLSDEADIILQLINDNKLHIEPGDGTTLVLKRK